MSDHDDTTPDAPQASENDLAHRIGLLTLAVTDDGGVRTLELMRSLIRTYTAPQVLIYMARIIAGLMRLNAGSQWRDDLGYALNAIEMDQWHESEPGARGDDTTETH